MAISATQQTELLRLVVGMYNAAAGASNLSWLAGLVDGTTDGTVRTTAQIASILNNEAAFKAQFAGKVTAADQAAVLLSNFGFATGTTAGDEANAFFQTRINAGQSLASLALDAATFLSTTTDTKWADAKSLLNNKVDVAQYYSVTKAQSGTVGTLQSILTNVTKDTASTTTVKTSIDTGAIGTSTGQSFTLTNGIDSFTGGNGNDTFTAGIDTAGATTFTALDALDGGAGADTLNISQTSAAALTLASSATVKNIETANITNATANKITADVQNWTGLTTIKVVNGAAEAQSVTTKGNVTTATSVGANAFTINDAATTDTLATVSVSNVTAASTITSDAIKTVNLTSTSGNVTLTAAAATRALTLTLDGVTGGTIADATATSLTLASANNKVTGATVNAVKATSVTINAGVATTIANAGFDAATTITATGSALATLTAATLTALTTVDSTASTGGLASVQP